MLDPNFFDNLAKQLSSLIPSNVQHLREEFEKNVRATVQGIFSKLDLVSREEFDVQTKLLEKARNRIAALEEKINSYEAKIAPDDSKDEG
jgi:BMFP domain-containing protein YqiC